MVAGYLHFALPAAVPANGLTHCTGPATPDFEDILGVALATNAVAVNGGLANSEG